MAYPDELQDLDAQIEEQEVESTDTGIYARTRQEIAREESRIRGKLARNFIWWYFGLLLVIIVGAPIYNYWAKDVADGSLLLSLKDLLQVYSSIVGPLAGFVIAYYFKNK